MLCIALLLIFLNFTASENCLIYNNTVDCCRVKIKSIVTKVIVKNDTEILIFEGQPLENISNKTFENAGNLKILNLKNCKLNFVHRDTFKYMNNLQEIDLSFNEIISLDKNIFKSNNKLEKVWLNNNKLDIIKNYNFINQKSLKYLYLQNNLLSNLSVESFPTYTSLILLNITNNKINFIDYTIIENSEYLDEIYMDHNSLKCDCKIKKLYKILNEKQYYGINTRCSEPEPLKNEVFMELRISDFTCPIDVYSETSIITYKSNFTLTCNIFSENEPYLMWKYNNNAIFNNEKYLIDKNITETIIQYNLTIRNLTVFDTGLYECSAKNTGYFNSSKINFKFQNSEKPIFLIPKYNFVVVDLHESDYIIPFKIYSIPKPKVTFLYNDKILEENSTFKSVYYNQSIYKENVYWYNLTIKKVKLKYRTQFSCVAKNLQGSTQKNVTLRILYPQPINFVRTRNYTTVTEQQNASLLCALTAVPQPDMIWKYRHLKIGGIVTQKYKIQQDRDENGTYRNTLTIFKAEAADSGYYICEANNSQIVHSKIFFVQVKELEEPYCESNISSTIFIAVGCALLLILLALIVCKCCIRYHVSKNWSPEFSYRTSMLHT